MLKFVLWVIKIVDDFDSSFFFRKNDLYLKIEILYIIHTFKVLFGHLMFFFILVFYYFQYFLWNGFYLYLVLVLVTFINTVKSFQLTIKISFRGSEYKSGEPRISGAHVFPRNLWAYSYFASGKTRCNVSEKTLDVFLETF